MKSVEKKYVHHKVDKDIAEFMIREHDTIFALILDKMIQQISRSQGSILGSFSSTVTHSLCSIFIQDTNTIPMLLPPPRDNPVGDEPKWVDHSKISCRIQEIKRVSKLVRTVFAQQRLELQPKCELAKRIQRQLEELVLEINGHLSSNGSVENGAEVLGTGLKRTFDQTAVELGGEDVGSRLSMEPPFFTVSDKYPSTKDI